MKIQQLKHLLYDARFIKSIEIINAQDKLKAIYMVRLYTGFGLAMERKYVDTINRFKNRMNNPLQY